MKQHNKSSYFTRPILAGVVVLVLVTLSCVAVLKNHKQQMTIQPTVVKVSPTPTAEVTPTVPPGTTPTGDGSYVIHTNIPNQMRFVSPKLGISFVYQYKYPIDNEVTTPSPRYYYTLPLEVKNRVTLRDNLFSDNPGPFIEIFQKDPNISLVTAIKNTFLKGFSENDCIVNIKPRWHESNKYEVASIDVPYRGTITPEEMFYRSKKCPAIYTQGNLESYFAYDKAHPDKYIFFYIGQTNDGSGYPEPYDTAHPSVWDQTLQFIN